MKCFMLAAFATSMVIMPAHAAVTWQSLSARSLSAAVVPDPRCATGIVSLKEANKPQSCCPSYCGKCDDYPTCQAVRGMKSENACCASKVYEMRCGNAPANVCLKTCSDAVPPCIMDLKEIVVKVGKETAADDCGKAVPEYINKMKSIVKSSEALKVLDEPKKSKPPVVDGAMAAALADGYKLKYKQSIPRNGRFLPIGDWMEGKTHAQCESACNGAKECMGFVRLQCPGAPPKAGTVNLANGKAWNCGQYFNVAGKYRKGVSEGCLLFKQINAQWCCQSSPKLDEPWNNPATAPTNIYVKNAFEKWDANKDSKVDKDDLPALGA